MALTEQEIETLVAGGVIPRAIKPEECRELYEVYTDQFTPYIGEQREVT